MRAPETIYSDNDIIVVNKPPGISVHRGDFIREETLVDFLARKFPEIRSVGDNPRERPGIVHRLDRDTSGVLVLARNQESFLALKSLFKNRLVEKVYWAIVCGRIKQKSGVITSPIGRLAKSPSLRGIQPKKGALRGARDAITEYRVVKEGKSHSLLHVRPKTGRTHQIRVHLKSIGNPIACDRVYGGKNVCCPEGAHRQLLHAYSLSFSFSEGRGRTFEADPPQDFLLAKKQIGL